MLSANPFQQRQRFLFIGNRETTTDEPRSLDYQLDLALLFNGTICHLCALHSAKALLSLAKNDAIAIQRIG